MSGFIAQAKVPRWLIWSAWIVLAGVCAIGLRNYRVSNSMDAWMPDLAAPRQYQSYLVIGFSSDVANPNVVAAAMRSLASTAFCIDPAMVMLSSHVTGVTPDDFVVGSDGRYYGLFCFPHEGIPDSDYIKQVESALTPIAPRSAFAIGGPAAFRDAMDIWSQSRLAVILGAILFGGGLMLWLISGSTRIASVSMLAISLSQVIFIGSISWLRIPLDMALALVPPMMMGLGFSYAAHRALRRRSLGILAVCGLAAAAGIASFTTADLLPVRHFAMAGVPGLCLVWVVTVSLVKPDHAARRRRIGWMRLARNFSLRLSHHLHTIFATAFFITFAAVIVAPRLQVLTNSLNFFPATSQIYVDFATLDQRLTGMLPSQVVVSGNVDPRAMLLETPGMRKVINVSAWIGGPSRTFLCLANDDAAESLAAHLVTWESWGVAHHSRIEWHGIAAQIHRSGMSMRQIAVESLPSMMFLIATTIFVLFRNWRLAMIGAWICALPVLALILVAVLTSWKLGPVTLVIGSITTGLAVDDTLHLMTASRRRRSVKKAIIECWKPCVGSSLAGIVCFSLFTISPFEPTSQFGILMALATALAMIGNQSVLPAFLALTLNIRDEI